MNICIKDINNYLNGKIDIFISSSSFEERCLSIPKNLNVDNIINTIICHYHKSHEKVENNLLKLKDIFRDKLDIIEFDRDKPLTIADNFIEKLLKLLDSKTEYKVLIDITTFTHESLLIILKIIRLYFRIGSEIKFIYTCPEDYNPQETNKENKWLSREIQEIRSILGYAGIIDPTKKNHLIVLTGFEIERALNLIDNFEPHFVSLGNCSKESAIKPEFYEINKLNLEKLSNYIKLIPHINKFTFSCDNSLNTKNDIRKQIIKHQNCNTIIAPMNTKISTLGTALVSFENPDVQLCYAKPGYYNFNDYSSPSSNCYLFEIDDFIQESDG